MKLRCTTLFDITKTNVSNRRQHLELDQNISKQRNQQSNLETILQIISLRSQPENITDPEIMHIKLDKDPRWGENYKSKSKIPCWSFTFTVNHSKVFASLDNDLEYLLQDCNGVPMITQLDEFKDLQNKLSIESEDRNIFFEIESDE